MDKIGQVSLSTITLFGKTIEFNPVMFIMTWLIMGLLVLTSILVVKKLSMVPGKGQSIFELIIQFFEDIMISTMGKEEGRRLLPLIVSIFIFILASNWIGILPNIFHFFGAIIAGIHYLFSPEAVTITVEGITNISIAPNTSTWYTPLFKFPAFEEPTKFLSTDLGIALLVFLVCHITAIKNKGFITYLRGYIDDPFPMKGIWTLFFWINPFFYLNIVGQIANVVSHSFRLFGNIFGGGIIIIIVSELLRYFLIPVGLFAFFGLFAGIIQAFVFSMLAVSYINQLQ